MRGLTFAAIGAAVGLVMAVVLGAGSIVIYRGAGAFTTSAMHAMGFRIGEIAPKFLAAGIILGLIASTIKPRDPEAEAVNRLLVKGLGWHLFVPIAAFLFLYVISRESLTSMAFFLFAMMGSVMAFITRSHHFRTKKVYDEIPPVEVEGELGTMVWHPAWSDKQPHAN